MREIIFRGKNSLTGKWVEGLLVETRDNFRILAQDDMIPFGVVSETVGQYTGLTDKNGEKIFEGDIVTMPSYGKGKHKSAVYFADGKFAVDGSNYCFKDICPRNMEVIGNIYDNRELLGGKNNA